MTAVLGYWKHDADKRRHVARIPGFRLEVVNTTQDKRVWVVRRCNARGHLTELANGRCSSVWRAKECAEAVAKVMR